MPANPQECVPETTATIGHVSRHARPRCRLCRRAIKDGELVEVRVLAEAQWRDDYPDEWMQTKVGTM